MEPHQLLGGRYRLTAPLGAGGMSVVWRATDELLGRTVVIKVLARESAVDEAARAMVLAEAQAAARVSHTNVASVYDFGEWSSPDGRVVPYIVMEPLSGPSLSRRLDAGPLEPWEALRLAGEIATGLAAAHDAGLVHRDVKPSNVMLSPGGAKLVDFGIAAIVGEPEHVDDDGYILGTPAYLPPERRTPGQVVPESDLYAWAVLLHRMLTGRVPWPPDATMAQRAEHLQSAAPLPGVPDDIDALYRRCLAPDPLDRPSAREAAITIWATTGIRPLLGGDHSPAIADQPTAPVPARSRNRDRRRRARAAVVVALPVAIAAIVVTVILTPGPLVSFPDGHTGTGTGTVTDTGTGTETGVDQLGSTASTSVGPAIDTEPAPPGPNPGASGLLRPPPGEPSAAGTTPAPATSAPLLLTLVSPGGKVVVSCDQGFVHVYSVSPAPGFAMLGGIPAPDDHAEVSFKAGMTTVRMSITCANGVPVRTVTVEGN